MSVARCGACAAPVSPMYRPPSAEQAPDLDLRPGEPARSTLPRWLARCGSCGAVAPDLSALPSAAAGVVRGAAYRDAGEEADRAVRPFLRWSALLAGLGDRAGAADALLHAAWAAEDAGDAVGAVALRRQAAASWGVPRDERSALRLVDVLRRAGQFYDAGARAAELESQASDDSTQLVMAFQRARIAEGDTGRHLMSSALRPPARTPHAAHGRTAAAPTRSLWSRLLGR